MNIFEMPVIPNERMVQKVYNRLPKTKNKRIVKKWKRYKYTEIPRTDALIFAFGIMCHPTMVEKVEQGLEIARSQNNDNGSGETQEEADFSTISKEQGTKISTMGSSKDS